jgi:hypothetical protein
VRLSHGWLSSHRPHLTTWQPCHSITFLNKAAMTMSCRRISKDTYVQYLEVTWIQFGFGKVYPWHDPPILCNIFQNKLDLTQWSHDLIAAQHYSRLPWSDCWQLKEWQQTLLRGKGPHGPQGKPCTSTFLLFIYLNCRFLWRSKVPFLGWYRMLCFQSIPRWYWDKCDT